MVGTIFDLKRFAIHDGPGIRTTVFFNGCPLDCWWCHNPEGKCLTSECEPPAPANENGAANVANLKPTIGYTVTTEILLEEIMKDEVFYDQSGGGVTFSGGEPIMQLDFLMSLLRECRRLAVHTAVDTSGYVSQEAFDEIYDLVNLFLFDLKLMDENEHLHYTGMPNQLILENLIALASRGEKVIIRIPMIPGITDTSENLEAVAAFLKPLEKVRRISLLPYNQLGEDKSERYRLRGPRYRGQPQTPEDMNSRREWFESLGYEVGVGG